MARASERLKLAVATATELLQSQQKIKPQLKAQLCELIMRLEMVEIERKDAREQRTHELKLADLKSRAPEPTPDAIKAAVDAYLENLRREKNGQ